MKKFIVIFLAMLMCFNFVSCNKKNGETNGNVNIKFSDTIIAQDGKTDYKIVMPSDADEKTQFAASELKQFMYDLVQTNIPLVTDGGLVYDENSKYLSVGETSIASAAGISVTEAEVTGEGFRIATKGKSVFLLGGGSNGVMYSVYDFLETVYGVKIYAEDEIYIPEVKKAFLPILDYKETPSLQIRSIGSYELNNNQTLRRRMRTHLRQEGWIYTSHSFFAIMPKATYLDAHSDWYSPDKTQLCLSNEEMTEEFIKNLYNLYNLPQYKDAVNCMIGIEDSNTFCTCSKCTADTLKYKESGIMVRFVNKVYDGVRKMLDVNGQQNRKIRLFMYAYFKTLSAPVDAQGKPLDESVIPNDNIGLMIAPLSAKYDVALNHTENIDVTSQITAWNTIFKQNIYMYIYGANYGIYPLIVNDFGSIKENYNYFKNFGAIGVFHLDAHNALSSNLSQLKNYMQSRLMWDTSLDSEELIEDFAKHYYRTAAPYIMDYINLWRMQYHENVINYNKHCIVNTTASKTWIDSKYWPLDFLNACDDLFEKAFAAIEQFEDTEPELYNKLSGRLKLQSLSHRFLKLSLYTEIIPVSQLLEEIDDFEKDAADVGMIYSGEHTNTSPTIAEHVEKWRLAALNRVE